MKKLRPTVALMLSSILIWGCSEKAEISLPDLPTDQSDIKRGQPIGLEHLEGYAAFTAKAIVWSAGMSG